MNKYANLTPEHASQLLNELEAATRQERGMRPGNSLRDHLAEVVFKRFTVQEAPTGAGASNELAPREAVLQFLATDAERKTIEDAFCRDTRIRLYGDAAVRIMSVKSDWPTGLVELTVVSDER